MKKTRLHIDGAPDDGVGHDLASLETFAQFKKASDALRLLQVPTIVRAKNRSERLFVAAFDGTGNNKFLDPVHATNVAKIDDQIMARGLFQDAQVYSRYIQGPGTQDSKLISTLDSALGHSFESNIEEAYLDLVQQANRWARKDPDTVVRVNAIGFSRGGSQVATFARWVHERGIPDLESLVRGPQGSTRYERYIAQPGQVIQTVGLFDPVATGAPMNYDRRLPDSVVSGFQITAASERRASFPTDQIIPLGFSKDGRFLNVMVPGAHSDVGGGYLRNGLSIRCGNLMRDYCNALRDEPYLDKVFEPTEQRLNVIHRSTEGKTLFRLDPRVGVRGEASGTNTQLMPSHLDEAGAVPHGPEPMNRLLDEGWNVRGTPDTPANMIQDHPNFPPASTDALLAGGRSRPLEQKLVRRLGFVGDVIDAGVTFNEMHDSWDNGNKAGAGSHALHFVSRNAAGWAGAHVMMAAGAAVGIETGPGVLVTGGLGAAIGFFAGDKIVDKYDHYRIEHQQDTQGNMWTMREGGQVWTRDIPPLPGTPYGERLTADAALAHQLTFQSANTAVELLLAQPRKPIDPFKQPAAPGDTPSLVPNPWTHRPAMQQWHRLVTDGYSVHGMARTHVEEASQQRAAELNQLAEQTTRQNVVDSAFAVAQRYAYAYEQEGWYRHGPMPEVVSHVLRNPVEQILASDGNEYSRDVDGQWTHPGLLFGTTPASPGIRDELDLAERPTRALRDDVEIIPPVVPPVLPIVPPRLDHPAHPDHEFFREVRGHVVELDKSLGRGPDHYTDRISSALTVQARADGLERVDHIGLSEHGDLLGAVQTSPWWNDHQLTLRTQVATAEAETPMEISAAKWPAAMRQFERYEQARTEKQQPARGREPAGLSNVDRSLAGQEHRPHSPDDPRNPASKHHDLYNELHRCLPDASENRLVQFTAECHRNRITAKNLNEVHLDNHNLTMNFDSADFMSTPAQVDLNVPPPEPAEAIQQMRQFDQWMEEIRQQSQQHAQAIQQGPVMGG